MKSKRKGKKYPVEILTKREIKKLVGSIDTETMVGKRDMCALVLMYRGGLRAQEALDLLVKNIDWTEEFTSVVHVLHGKGDSDRKVALDKKSTAILREWVDAAELGDSDPVLESVTAGGNIRSRGEPMSYVALNKRLKGLADDVGIKKRVSCHVFRHTMAYEMLQENINPMVISKQLGHTSLATTMTYLDHLCPSERFKVTEGREW